MAITFQCKRSGNFLVVDQVDDIVQMRKHEGYVEVGKNSATIEPEVIEKPAESVEPTPLPAFLTPTVQTESRRGRPRKAK